MILIESYRNIGRCDVNIKRDWKRIRRMFIKGANKVIKGDGFKKGKVI